MDDVIELTQVGKKGGPPAKHYMQLSHEDWSKLQKAPIFGGRLVSPTQLREILMKLATGEYKLVQPKKVGR